MAIDPLTQQQHHLPRFYQRRWTGADGRLVVFERPRDLVVARRRFPRETGKERGIYAVPMAPDDASNVLEDGFWRLIDQWGADALAAIEAEAPGDVPDLERERWAVFLLSLTFRDPSSIARIDRSAREHYDTGFVGFAAGYCEFRRPNEPETFAEFIASFDRPGMSELGAATLRYLATNREILDRLLAMDWQVVTVGDPPVWLLTSDRPVIRHRGLAHGDGLMMLPLGPYRFFVAFNAGPQDMRSWIEDSIVHGRFMQAMNEYVVRSADRFVYGFDDVESDQVERDLRRPGDPVLERW